jgi:nitrogen-specific signal transduction histidine kinase
LLELRIQAGSTAGSVLLYVCEVTDRARVQRLGAIVETLVALGHEIANPLAILRGEIELARRQFPAESDQRFQVMLGAADRIDAVMRRLRTLTQPTPTDYLRSRGVRMINLVQREPGTGEESSP